MVEASGGDLDAGGRSCVRPVRWDGLDGQHGVGRLDGLDWIRQQLRKRRLEHDGQQWLEHEHESQHQEEAPQEQLLDGQRRLRRQHRAR